MKIAAIYTVWDDWKMFACSIKNINHLVDGIVLVQSEISNYGEKSPTKYKSIPKANFFVENFDPDLKKDARTNETEKRNIGLRVAKENGFTHFVMMDADEFYKEDEFLNAKKRFLKIESENKNFKGFVCRSIVYFKKPTLTIGYDVTLVPFIHRITETLCFTWNENYPFAWTDTDAEPFTKKRRIRIDPTRQMNINDGVEWSSISMHHYSWVRSDIFKKINNSTAKDNILRSSIVNDYLNADDKYFCNFYGKVLASCPNYFNVPELIDTHDFGLRPS